jgi:hypothetical protein
MPRNLEMSPMYQCGECETLFLQFVTQELDGYTYDLCPNPSCNGPRSLCNPIQNNAVWWLFTHIVAHSGMGETRRMHLRCIAESQMGPWNELYRLF